MTARTVGLPPVVRRPLDEGDPVAAGEALRRFAEELVRREPGEARRWARELPGHAPAELSGWVDWAAGIAFYLAGEAEAAERHLGTAARILRRRGLAEQADRAAIPLIDLYGERLDLRKARTLAQRLSGNFGARKDRERGAAVLINLGCAEDAADRVATARGLWRQACRTLPAGSLRRLLTEANLANVWVAEGRLREAVAEYGRIAKAATDCGWPAVALQAELNRAEAEFSAGWVDEALARWQEVAEAARSSGDAGVEVVVELDLAEAEIGLGDAGRARRRLAHAVPMAHGTGLEREILRGRRLEAVVMAAEGELGAWRRALRELSGSRYAMARDLLLSDVAQLDPSCDPRTVAAAARRLHKAGLRQRGWVALAWAARRALEWGRPRAARRLAREVATARGVSPWARLIAWHTIGRCEPERAIAALTRAAHYADLLNGRLAAAADQEAFLTLRGEVYVDLLTALLDRGRRADRKKALETVNRMRAGWLVNELGRRADRGDDPQIRRWKELRRRLSTLLREAEGDSEQRLRRSGLKAAGAIRALDDELRLVETELARRHPELGLGLGERPDVIDDLTRLLPSGDRYVEYFLGADDLVIFAVSSNSLHVERRRGVAQEIRRLVASTRFHLDAHAWTAEGAPAASRRVFDQRLNRLSELLLGPVAASGNGPLWLAPQDGLFHLPWAALPVAGSERLGLLGPLTLVPGAAAAVRLLRQPQARPKRVALTGAPDERLPMIGEEIRRLREVLPDATVVETAGRREFLSVLTDYELVHLAGHAVFLDGSPSASGLRLSDGYVTVHDVAATRLSAYVVTFGVCSGLRMGPRGGDHYAGFLQALVAGGVRTVIGATGAVRDEVAFVFGTELHRSLRDAGDPARAYRDAVTAVTELDPHPATWGIFHLYGDMRPWETS
ncbi:MAG: CHAT domain-containing tetratricopeptide repeat protein [Acidobacteria bacterium]|nr:CHAT domain-containing tetratricopeptide repeat protein [Acidobacteriota bacterium]